ncbi:hypothetical protein F5Y08DRAFT_96553 [Xylaria arbuscula]|nr:hypothetical protein F5Y08DRAFT_96553 [Xylaria arbuscula]
MTVSMVRLLQVSGTLWIPTHTCTCTVIKPAVCPHTNNSNLMPNNVHHAFSRARLHFILPFFIHHLLVNNHEPTQRSIQNDNY